eukprot:1815588-Rhodomonas_salina.1
MGFAYVRQRKRLRRLKLRCCCQCVLLSATRGSGSFQPGRRSCNTPLSFTFVLRIKPISRRPAPHRSLAVALCFGQNFWEGSAEI